MDSAKGLILLCAVYSNASLGTAAVSIWFPSPTDPQLTLLMAATKMDWQKTMLIAAMGAVVFTLIIRWSDFQVSMAHAERLPAAERRAAPESAAQEQPEANESGASELPSIDNQHLDVPRSEEPR